MIQQQNEIWADQDGNWTSKWISGLISIHGRRMNRVDKFIAMVITLRASLTSWPTSWRMLMEVVANCFKAQEITREKHCHRDEYLTRDLQIRNSNATHPSTTFGARKEFMVGYLLLNFTICNGAIRARTLFLTWSLGLRTNPNLSSMPYYWDAHRAFLSSVCPFPNYNSEINLIDDN
jgi:hypothetical protein